MISEVSYDKLPLSNIPVVYDRGACIRRELKEDYEVVQA